jgi:endonuclease/exonuclease/phosphatase family metal-dependent hydrolase
MSLTTTRWSRFTIAAIGERRRGGRLRILGLVALAVLGLPALAAAVDVRVAGRRLVLRASPAGNRRAVVVVRDAAIQPQFPDPSLGATLVVASGPGPDPCQAEIALAPAAWAPLGGNGATRGWRYLDPDGTAGGVRRVVLRPGYLAINARDAGWPCALSWPQSEPLTVELRVGGTRWCSSFGGDVLANYVGRFRARNAPPPPLCPKADVTLANLNVLHGLFCPPATDSCRRPERTDLLYEWVVRRGCPDVVTFQEVFNPVVPLLSAGAATACPFPYNVVYEQLNTLDDEMLLSRWPVLDQDVIRLLGNFRTVLWARIDHPIGPVDVFTTHLASGSDGAGNPCGPSCPPECVAAGAATVRQCQAVQVGAFVTAHHDVGTPALVAGDFNEQPGSFVYQHLVGLGWIDTFLAAGNAECVPATGVGCTSGRDDVSLVDLEVPASNETVRIDYTFLVPPAAAPQCSAMLDSPTDDDGNGTATRLFAELPNPADPGCGPAPAAICWPSDHVGTEADVDCF